MSADRDVTRIVRSWLHGDAHEDADRVLNSVLDQLETTTQRRPWWPARRFLSMNNNARIALAAAAVVVVGLIGYELLIASNVGGPPPAPSSTPSAPTASELPALPMPGARVSSAGEYGWTGELGSVAGMHNVVVVDDGTSAFRQTQIVFAVENDCFGSPGGSTPTTVTAAGFHGLYVEAYEPPDERIVMFTEQGLETTGAYALAIGDRTLCVYLSWDPTTTAAELAAARAVIESLRAEPVGATSIRITFTLEAGWDTG